MRCSAKIEETLLFFPSKEARSSPLSQQTHGASSKVRSNIATVKTVNFRQPQHKQSYLPNGDLFMNSDPLLKTKDAFMNSRI